MANQTHFFVHDKTRMCRAVTGAKNYAEAIKEGYREVTGEEQDTFRAETRRIWPHKFKEVREE